jgi:hypothetical protein
MEMSLLVCGKMDLEMEKDILKVLMETFKSDNGSMINSKFELFIV